MENTKVDVLVIGCGNIGAMYDLDKEDILTHSKAFFLNSNFNLTVYDIDGRKSELISNTYNCKVIFNLENLNNYNIISICTPTDLHFLLLKRLFKLKIPLIICEKPISNNLDELIELEFLYNKSNTRVLINYFRRFHPNYIDLKTQISEIVKKDRLVNILVRYQKGFLNNCSHAIDLIEFILNININFDNFISTNFCYDHFINDPTISLTGSSNNINFSFLGISNIEYSFFEVEFYFEKSMIKIEDSGSKIKYFHNQVNANYFLPLEEDLNLSKTNAISNRMMYVIQEADKLYNVPTSDNFLTSLNLNFRMLSVLKKK